MWAPVHNTPAALDQLAAAHESWSSRLWQSTASTPTMSLILDELVLSRQVGGFEVMVEQLEHLCALARDPRLCVRILPLAVGASPALRGSFEILDLQEPTLGPLLVVGDALNYLQIRDDPAEVAGKVRAFQRLMQMAAPPEHTVAILEEAIRRLDRPGLLADWLQQDQGRQTAPCPPGTPGRTSQAGVSTATDSHRSPRTTAPRSRP